MKTKRIYIALLSATLSLFSVTSLAEKYETKDVKVAESFLKKYGYCYDAKNANAYPIPNVLDRIDTKKKVKNALEWSREVRPQIIDFFDNEVYGQIPPRPDTIKFDLFEKSDNALGGIAERKQYKITVGGAKGELSFHVLLYVPKGAKNVPAFICPNFNGNDTISPEEEVFKIDVSDLRSKKAQKRGHRASRIPVAEIVSRGYAIATFCYEELYNDNKTDKARQNSVYSIFEDDKFVKGGAISAWAWGNMRVMDLLETLPEIDPKHVGVVGHSRLGKTSLLTGAHDTRFSYVCVNNSGCMGDALSKRKYGENIDSMMNINFPYWFLPCFKKYANNEGALPLDQHHLLATIAPRMLYTTAATEDVWADPEGQLLGLIHASPAFALFGGKNYPTLDALEIENPFHGDVAFHIRKGRHNITPYDWNNFMDYAELRGWKPFKK